MSKIYCLLFVLFIFSKPLLDAQYTKVNLDFESSYIGENDPLPAAENLLLSGAIPTYIDRLEVKIYPSKGRQHKEALHTSVWQRPLGNKDAAYSLPIHYKLRPSSQYDIAITFFRSVKAQEREALLQLILRRTKLYLDSQRSPNDQAIRWEQKPKKLLRAMNGLLRTDLKQYRAALTASQEEFSELVRLQLEKMESIKGNRDSLKRSTNPQEAFQVLEQLLQAELVRIIPEQIYRAADSRYLEDCPTEDKRGALSINAGYGGTYLSGDLGETFEYDTAPYAGLSFPLGNSNFAPRIFSNTYLGFGLFLDNLDNGEEGALSGPVVGRPIYASLDHRLFQFIYLNAGATLLEKEKADDSSVLLIRPFIGLSAKINLSLRFDR